MSVGYRSVLQLDAGEDAIRVANGQFREWLAEKAADQRSSIVSFDWDGPGVYPLGPDTELTVVEHLGEGNRHRLLLELVDKNHKGIWTTRLYAASAPHSKKFPQVLWFEGEGKKSDGSSIIPGTPRVVKRTLETINAHDSGVPVLSEPLTIRKDDIDTLVGYITDTKRAVSVVVATPVPGLPTHIWRDAVTSLTRDTLGCASFFVLDAGVDNLLNERLGDSHAIPPGAIRTFAPHTDLEDPSDSRRHRILTTRTMERGLVKNRRFSERLVRAIAVAPRRALLETELPSELIRTVRILQRERISNNAPAPVGAILTDRTGHDPEITISARQENPVEPLAVSAGHSAEQLREIVDRLTQHNAQLHEALSVLQERLTEARNVATDQSHRLEVITAEANRLQSERESLEDHVSKLHRSLENEQIERELAEIERRKAEKKLRSLEHWLSTREDQHEYIEPTNEPWESDPVNVTEIVERLTDKKNFGEILRYVELTDIDRAINNAYKVDEIDSTSSYASAFWEYVLVLYDFAKERIEGGFKGGMHQYLTSSTTHGRKCPTARHKPNESETVQNNIKMRRERTFPVPTTVKPEGKVFMAAHFAPTHRDQNAPRMYYYDDLSNTRKIYIGYIGIHLTNTKTN